MRGTCRRLAGEAIPYPDEVCTLFDVEPVPVPAARFEAAGEELRALVPGVGSLPERMAAYRRAYEYPVEKAPGLFDLVVAEARRRTVDFLDLPPGEGVVFELVKDKPWSGYNWFLGDARSKVEINTDVVRRVLAAYQL